MMLFEGCIEEDPEIPGEYVFKIGMGNREPLSFHIPNIPKEKHESFRETLTNALMHAHNCGYCSHKRHVRSLASSLFRELGIEL